MQNTPKKTGFINTIILIVLALVILGYFNIDVRNVLISPGVQNNLNYAGSLVLTTLDRFVATVATLVKKPQ